MQSGLAQKVLLMPSATGSSGNTMHIRVAALEEQPPLAMINLEPDSPSVRGCVIAEIPSYRLLVRI